MNYTKIRTTAHIVSLICLLLIFVVSTSKYVAAATQSDSTRTGISSVIISTGSRQTNCPFT